MKNVNYDKVRSKAADTRPAAQQHGMAAGRSQLDGAAGNFADDALLMSIRAPKTAAHPRMPAPGQGAASQGIASLFRKLTASSSAEKSRVDKYAQAIANKTVGPLQGLRHASADRSLAAYAEASYAALSLLPAGGFDERTVLWHLYLGFAAYGDKRAPDVLRRIFAPELASLSLKDYAAARDIRYLLKFKELKVHGHRTSVAEAVSVAKSRVLEWCDLRQLKRVGDRQRNNDYVAVVTDLYAYKDTLNAMISEPPTGL